MRYKAVKTEVVDPSICSPEWEKATEGVVGVDRWKEYLPSPATSFKLLHGPEGISLLMHSKEQNLRAECTEENGSVYLDSCMEFFFKPDPLDVNYLNFEINPKGVMHLGLGAGRHDRRLLDTDRAVFNIEACVTDEGWSVKLYIPNSFLLEHFGQIAPVCKGNFYKCGDGTDHVHYGVWSEVEVPAPDFHIPDFFGRIEL